MSIQKPRRRPAIGSRGGHVPLAWDDLDRDVNASIQERLMKRHGMLGGHDWIILAMNDQNRRIIGVKPRHGTCFAGFAKQTRTSRTKEDRQEPLAAWCVDQRQITETSNDHYSSDAGGCIGMGRKFTWKRRRIR
jgi:hypothetical protein